MSACHAGDLGSIPGSGRSPGEGNGNPPQYSCLENPMDGGAWWATVHGVAKSQTQLNDFTFSDKRGDWTQWILCRLWLVVFSCCHVQFFVTPWTPARLVCLWNFLGKNMGVVAISLSRGFSKGIEPALAGRFFTTEPPGKPLLCR